MILRHLLQILMVIKESDKAIYLGQAWLRLNGDHFPKVE